MKEPIASQAPDPHAAQEGPSELRIVALAALSRASRRELRLDVRAWSFKCRCQRELDEVDHAQRALGGEGRDLHGGGHTRALVRWAGGQRYHLMFAFPMDARAAAGLLREAPIHFAALSHWGAGPLDGHASSHAAPDHAQFHFEPLMAMADASVGSFVERLALAEHAPLMSDSKPARPRL